MHSLQLTDAIYVPEEDVISFKGTAVSDITPVVESSQLLLPSNPADNDYLTDEEVSYL